uniref:Ig-like domain-containing protein n=1 Tax=Callorhinchus milii TaxID=7868 RepID=A0A4W3H2L4_CALMI
TPLKIFSKDPKIGSPAPLTLVCETTAFYPENLNFTWYKNGTKITSGINITKQQNAEGLYEASSFVEENKPIQSGVDYICEVSHISLRIPEIANYTVQCSKTGLTFLVLLIIGIACRLTKSKGKTHSCFIQA